MVVMGARVVVLMTSKYSTRGLPPRLKMGLSRTGQGLGMAPCPQRAGSRQGSPRSPPRSETKANKSYAAR